MIRTLPGSTIEVSGLSEGVSRMLFSGIFATGGITLSQVSVMTGLEPYMIQNWVKRGFVSSPVKRQYSKDQFARIVIINNLRETLQIDSICRMLRHINGSLDNEADDLICDSELYHMYVDMLAENGSAISSADDVLRAAEKISKRYNEPVSGARNRLIKVLQVMAYAHYAALSHKAAEEVLSSL